MANSPRPSRRPSTTLTEGGVHAVTSQEANVLTADAKRSALREYVKDHVGHKHTHSEVPSDFVEALLPRHSDASGPPGGGGGGGGGKGGFFAPMADLAGSWTLVKSSRLNILILAAPLGLASEALGWPPSATFLLNLFALIPLALLLGCVTEDLSLRLGEVMGALVNATFGNVVEIILSIAALQKGLYQVVSTSLLGSILSNMLFVLGMSLMAGGLKWKVIEFNSMAAQASISLLLLSAISIVLPTAAAHLAMGSDEEPLSDASVLLMSRVTAVILLVVYFAYLYFQLGSHSEMFGAAAPAEGAPSGAAPASTAGSCCSDDEPLLSPGGASFWLLAITVLVAASSEALTGSIEEVSHTWGLSQGFLGFIVLPIAGNACEHVTAVFVAMKNKMDLCMGIAIGSSIQIGLLAIPLVTIVGWATGHPYVKLWGFSLAFDPFSALVLVLSVIHTSVMIVDAQSNWLEGLQLVATYMIIALAYAMTS